MAAERPKSNKRNYYRILYVQPDAPMEVVQASYRTIMQKLKAHPDLGGDHWNASVINAAFKTLGDPDKRRAYDKKLFKKSTWKSLGQQTNHQRRQDYSPDAEWEDFKPLIID
jgi:DnaJ-class molecular chaperone